MCVFLYKFTTLDWLSTFTTQKAWSECTLPVRRNMYVVKRNGREEAMQIDKIIARLRKLTYGFRADHCDPVLLARKVCDGFHNGVTTTQLDELAAETAASMAAFHPNYALLAARIAVSNLHKNTKKSFSETIKDIYNHSDKELGQKSGPVSDHVYEIIMKNAARLDSEIIYDRDFEYDYYSFKTLERSYLLRIDGKVVERPQHMLVRIAVGIHKDDIDSVLQAYHLMSKSCFIHASPSLLNAGSPQVQPPELNEHVFEAICNPAERAPFVEKQTHGNTQAIAERKIQ